jgi:outer membrane protein insertion porin family
LKPGFLLLAALAASLLVPRSLSAQTDTIEGIEIVGNESVDAGTYLFHITEKVGDPYDEAKAREDFQRLWATGFLDDLTLEVRDGERGKILRFIVKERKRIRSIEYLGSKALDQKAIEEKLTEEDAELKPDTFYDPAQIVKVEKIIREMLSDKGLPNGEVSSEVTNVANGVRVAFNIRDEQKITIKAINFTGLHNFSAWRLRWGMKDTKESHLFAFLQGGSLYSGEKLAGDMEKVRELYLNDGFVDVSFGDAELTYEDGSSRFLFWKHPKRFLTLTIPVSEGKQYRVGEVSVDGAKVFPENFVKAFFNLQPGEVYNESKIVDGLEKLREIYGARGYIQFTGFPVKRPQPDTDLVDVTINLQEDKQYFVNRIEFTGNTTTRDKVIRREVWLNEQDVMNMELLKLSIRRINQLGYFRPIEQPEIRPVPGEEDRLDIVLPVEEQNRNQFTFGGGVSGLEGAFLNLSFSTTNFLGRGETASFMVQTGSRTRNFQIALQEPWFLDKPITLGFDVFNRTLRLPQFTRQDTGASVVWGIPIKRFSRLFLNYGYTVIKTTEPDSSLFNDQFFYDPLSAIYLDPFFGAFGEFRQSKVTPTFVHNTVDQPIFARTGKRYTFSLEYAGGPLGGTVHFYKPTIEGVWYLPVSRTTNFGFRAMFSWVKGFNDSPVPSFERFFMGGENQIRGYDIRSVGPTALDETVDPPRQLLIGGTKMMLFNMEYYIPLAGPLRAVLFFDAGQAFLDEDQLRFSMFKELVTSTGAEMRFFVPVLNVPFRLIFAYNPNPPLFQPKTAFRFGVGSTF